MSSSLSDAMLLKTLENEMKTIRRLKAMARYYGQSGLPTGAASSQLERVRSLREEIQKAQLAADNFLNTRTRSGLVCEPTREQVTR
jgi:hypothetical protein